MAGSQRLSQQDIQDLLLVGSTNFRRMANILEEEIDVEPIIDRVVSDDMLAEADEDLAHNLRLMGLGMGYFATTMVTARGPRGPYDQIEKCDEFFNKALSWPDRDFRVEFRVSRRTFDTLVDILEQNPIFLSKGRKPQHPVRYQLACFLMRYGSIGASSRSAAHRMGLGSGTVYLYCRRVARALRELGLTVIVWGDDARHAESKLHFAENGFDQCIGIIDGSLIQLTAMPSVNGIAYICRKKFAAVNMQAVVDHKKRFISYEGGYPGSTPDVTIWKRSHLWRHRHEFFQAGEYLLADKGYPSSPYLLRPFTEPEVRAQPEAEKARRRQFNKNLSNKRIYVEHAFGMLKGRFPSLKMLATPDDIGDVHRLLGALLVIHNICIDVDDKPEDIEGYNADDVALPNYGGAEGDEAVDVPAGETDAALRTAGLEMRQNILNNLYPID